MRRFALGPKAIAILGGMASSVIAGLVFPYITVYLSRHAGYSITEAGGVVGLATAASIFVRMVAGGMIDRLAVTESAWIGLILVALLPLVLLLGPSALAVVLGLVAYTLGGIFFDSAVTLMIYVDGATDVDKRINYSYYYAAHNAALAIAPAVTFIVAPGDYRKLFIAALLVQAILVAAATWIRFKKRSTEGRKRKAQEPRGHRLYAGLFTAGFLITFALGACYSLVYQQYFTNIANLLGRTQLLGREVYPLIVALNGAFVIIFQPLYARFLKLDLQLVDSLLVGAVCLLAGMLILALPVPIVTAIIPFAILFTLAEIFLNLGLVDNLMTFAPENARATWLSCFPLARTSSSIGIPTGAWLLDHFGASAFVSGLIAVAAAMCILAIANLRLKRVRADSTSLGLHSTT